MRPQSDGKIALAAGEGLPVVADPKEPPVRDGQAEWSVLAGTIRQGASVGTSVSLLQFLAVFDGTGNAFQPFFTGLPHPLVGFPSFLCTLLVYVVRGVCRLTVGLAPRGDALIDGNWGRFAAALGQFGFAVKDVHCVVVGGVLLRGVVADYPAVGRAAAEREFQGANRLGTLLSVVILPVWALLLCSIP